MFEPKIMLISKSHEGLYLSSLYPSWLVKLLAGAAGNYWNFSRASTLDRLWGPQDPFQTHRIIDKQQSDFRSPVSTHL